MLGFKKLAREKIEKLLDFDRTELVLKRYYMREGQLELVDERYDIADWSVEQKMRHIERLKALFDVGATFFGAFDEEKLVGMSVLDHAPVATGRARLNLEGLWVSDGYRSQGVGRRLFDLIVAAAKEQGAAVLYVSATSSENTIRFYQRIGCTHANPIDPALFEKEPEDIHLEFLINA